MWNRSNLLALSWVVIQQISALPTNPQVAAGNASISFLSEKSLEIVADDKSIVNWDSFSIDRLEHVRVIQPNSASALLLRDLGLLPSNILGELKANGHLLLINPNGILIGPSGMIDTASFIASALNIADTDFLSGDEMLFTSSSDGEIINFGTIRARAGDILLLAAHLENYGVLTADGNIEISAGTQILIQPDAQNPVHILTNGFQNPENLYETAIFVDGLIDAKGLIFEEGRIRLVAQEGRIDINGQISAENIQIDGSQIALLENAILDASTTSHGGTIDLKATAQYVTPSALLKADALENGDGGEISVISKDATRFYGALSAKGGSRGGNGGWMEVSGSYLEFQGTATAAAPFGIPGDLVLDPTNITISAAANFNVMGSPNFRPGPAAAAANLNTGVLVGLLNTNTTNVSVNSSGSISTPGNIGNLTVVDPILYNSSRNLTLNTIVPGVALGSITFNPAADVNNSGTGNLSIHSQGSVTVNAADIQINGDIDVLALLGSVTVLGDATIGELLTMAGSIQIGTPAQPIAQDVTLQILPGGSPSNIHAFGGSISIFANGNLSLTDGSIIAITDINIQNIQGDVHVKGTTFNIAEIICDAGPIHIGTPANPVGQDIIIESTANTTAQMFATDFDIYTTRDLILLCGPNSTTSAILESTIGDILIRLGRDLTVQGGNTTVMTGGASHLGSGGVFDLASINGSPFRNLTVLGGPGSVSQADLINIRDTIIGPLSGDVRIEGGGGNPSGAQFVSQFGNVIFQQVGGNLFVLGGSGDNSPTFLTSGIDMTMNVLGDVNVLGGAGVDSFGFIGPTENLQMQIGGALNQTGGTNDFAGSVISAGIDATIHVVQDITLLGGSGNFSGSSIAANGSLNMFTNQNLLCQGGSGMSSGCVFFGTTLQIQAADAISFLGFSNLTQNSFVSINVSGLSTIIAGTNMTFTNGSTFSNASPTDTSFFVVDNDFPSPPLFGPGSFKLDATSSLTTSMAPLKIYTSRRPLNDIEGLLNGVHFVPGPIYHDTDQEVWGIYYPTDPTGIPYTIAYKDTPGTLIAFSQDAIASFMELFRDLHPYSEYISDFLEFREFWNEEWTACDLYFLRLRTYYSPYLSAKYDLLKTRLHE